MEKVVSMEKQLVLKNSVEGSGVGDYTRVLMKTKLWSEACIKYANFAIVETFAYVKAVTLEKLLKWNPGFSVGFGRL